VPLARNEAAFSTPLRLSTGFSALFSSAHFLLMMYTSEITSGMIGKGVLVMMSIVWLSIFFTSAIVFVYERMSEPSPAARAKVKTTSSAVKGVPSWNCTPLRRLKRQVVGVTCCHLVARAGTRPSFLSRPTSGS